MHASSLASFLCIQLVKELELILGDENGSGQSRERWSQAGSGILKQGDLESTNNARISKAMAAFDDSHGNYAVHCHFCNMSLVVCAPKLL